MPYTPPRNAPYGNIYQIDTSHIDQLNNLMFQEQRQRQAKQEQEASALDSEFQKEIGNVRSADVPIVVDAYQKYKNITKDLLFNKKLQRDPKLYAEKQREANLAKADAFGVVAESKEQKDRLINHAKNMGTHRDLYDDNSASWISLANQTPTRGLKNAQWNGQPIDLSNDDTFMYKGGNTNWNKIVSDSLGSDQLVYGKAIPVGKEGLQEDVPVYTAKNNPAQIKSALVGQMGLRGSGRDASFWLKNITPEDSQAIIETYKKTPKEKLERMGMGELPDIMPNNPENDTDVASSLMAMQAFNNYEPKLHKTERRDNKETLLNKSKSWDMYMEGVRQKNRERLKSIKGADDGQPDDSFDIVEEMWNESQKNPISYTPANGKAERRFEVNLSPQQKEAFSYKYINIAKDGTRKPETLYPESGYFSADGQYFTPIFYKGEKSSTGKRAVDSDISRPIPVNIIRASEAKRNFGTKEAKDIMTGKKTSGGTNKPTKAILD